jgi:hypothetical protein
MDSKIIYCILFSLLSITLKLLGVIGWSWVWVLSAFVWVPVLAMSALFIALALLIWAYFVFNIALGIIEFIGELVSRLIIKNYGWKR